MKVQIFELSVMDLRYIYDKCVRRIKDKIDNFDRNLNDKERNRNSRTEKNIKTG